MGRRGDLEVSQSPPLWRNAIDKDGMARYRFCRSNLEVAHMQPCRGNSKCFRPMESVFCRSLDKEAYTWNELFVLAYKYQLSLTWEGSYEQVVNCFDT